MRVSSKQIQVSAPWGWNTWKLREHRIIRLPGEIGETNSEALQESLMALALENDQPITIIMHSPGGDVLDGLGMFDAIQSVSASGVHVTIHCVGPVASMAAVIFQAADHRVMTPNSRMLLHEVRKFSFMSSSTVSDAVNQAKELEIINDRLAALVADSTKGTQTPDDIKALWKRDCWLWPDEALALGLIDEVALVNLK